MNDLETRMRAELDLSPEGWASVDRMQFTTDNYEEVGHTNVNHLITLAPISDGSYRTYALLKGFAIRAPEITWSTRRLAILRGVTRITLSRHLSELSRIGLVIREERKGTSWRTHFPALDKVFPTFAAQCIRAALWGKVRADDDLRELVAQFGAALNPCIKNDTAPEVVSKMIQPCIKNDTSHVSEMIHKAVKEKQLKESPGATAPNDQLPEEARRKAQIAAKNAESTDEFLGQFPPRADAEHVELPDPNDKTPWIAKDHGDRSNSAAPVQAGGTDSAAEAVVDGIWTEKGLGGIDAMPEKQRRRWVTKVAEIVERWGGATKEQARLAWQAHTVKLGWKTDVNPFHKGFGDDFGPLLVGVRNGDITVEALRAEEEERPVPTTRDRAGNPHVYRPAEEVAVEVFE